MTHHRIAGDDGATVESRRPFSRTAGVPPAFGGQDACVPCQTSPSDIEAVFSDVCVCQKKNAVGIPPVDINRRAKGVKFRPIRASAVGRTGLPGIDGLLSDGEDVARRAMLIPLRRESVAPYGTHSLAHRACRGRESATERRAAGFAAALAGQVLAIGCPRWCPSVGPGP
jgi:hypothetical protein